MALSLSELSQGSSGDYRYGMGKKSCCDSCARGGPCKGCGSAAGKCGCPPAGLGQPPIGPDLEAPPLGYKTVFSTKPGTTSFSQPQGLVSRKRKQSATALIVELEFLVGTGRASPRVLQQKAWLARKALIESPGWEYAAFAQDIDSKANLEARLAAVERQIGTAGIGPKTMSYLSGLSGSFRDRPRWGRALSPAAQLASCIRGARCAPETLCCPTHDQPRVEDFYRRQAILLEKRRRFEERMKKRHLLDSVSESLIFDQAAGKPKTVAVQDAQAQDAQTPRQPFTITPWFPPELPQAPAVKQPSAISFQAPDPLPKTKVSTAQELVQALPQAKAADPYAAIRQQALSRYHGRFIQAGGRPDARAAAALSGLGHLRRNLRAARIAAAQRRYR
jgi:hypothetical protein